MWRQILLFLFQTNPALFVDVDGDGYLALGDCDDTNARVNRGAAEVCQDQIDNDCDGYVDEGCGGGANDADGDGYSVATGDCDDTNPTVHPNAAEQCQDGIDSNCNGSDCQ